LRVVVEASVVGVVVEASASWAGDARAQRCDDEV